MPSTFAKVVSHLLRRYLPHPQAGQVDLSGRHVIVTGASPGSLGFETARILADRGATITITSPRNVEHMARAMDAELAKTGVDTREMSAQPLDLCDTGSVGRFAAWYRERYRGRLHVLVNNAGIHRDIFSPGVRPLPTADGFEPHWRTNYLGAFHLTHALLPMLQESGLKSGDARVINVGSHLHDRGRNIHLFEPSEKYHSWQAYGLSKLALMHFSLELQRRFAGRYNLQACTVHPGSLMTNLTRSTPLPGRVGKLLGDVSSALASLVLLPASAGAQTVVMCAGEPSLQGGRYYYRCAKLEPSAECADGEVSRRLWEESLAWVESLPQGEPYN